MATTRPVTFEVQPGKVYSLDVTGADLTGHFLVRSTSAKRVRGKRSWVAQGEIVESGQRITIRFTEAE